MLIHYILAGFWRTEGELPVDGAIEPKHVGVLINCTITRMMCAFGWFLWKKIGINASFNNYSWKLKFSVSVAATQLTLLKMSLSYLEIPASCARYCYILFLLTKFLFLILVQGSNFSYVFYSFIFYHLLLKIYIHIDTI
jgi:hypothetical protein